MADANVSRKLRKNNNNLGKTTLSKIIQNHETSTVAPKESVNKEISRELNVVLIKCKAVVYKKCI